MSVFSMEERVTIMPMPADRISGFVRNKILAEKWSFVHTPLLTLLTRRAWNASYPFDQTMLQRFNADPQTAAVVALSRIAV